MCCYGRFSWWRRHQTRGCLVFTAEITSFDSRALVLKKWSLIVLGSGEILWLEMTFPINSFTSDFFAIIFFTDYIISCLLMFQFVSEQIYILNFYTVFFLHQYTFLLAFEYLLFYVHLSAALLLAGKVVLILFIKVENSKSYLFFRIIKYILSHLLSKPLISKFWMLIYWPCNSI